MVDKAKRDVSEWVYVNGNYSILSWILNKSFCSWYLSKSYQIKYITIKQVLMEDEKCNSICICDLCALYANKRLYK